MLKKCTDLKASDLLKNFSRAYHDQDHQDELPLKMKCRKVAFTSRIIHSKQNQTPDSRKIPTESHRESHIPKVDLKLGGEFVWTPPPNRKKLCELVPVVEKYPEKDIFNFKSNSSFKRRILSPKVLRINVENVRTKPRSMSAKETNQLPKNRSTYSQQPRHNPEISPFEFTFGLNERF